jgi:hypothetical protein
VSPIPRLESSAARLESSAAEEDVSPIPRLESSAARLESARLGSSSEEEDVSHTAAGSGRSTSSLRPHTLAA